MNESIANSILKSYETLESSLLDFLSIVPPSKQNNSTWSPKLVNILLDCGSLLDSYFRAISPKEIVRVRKGRKRKVKRREFNIDDFRIIFNNQGEQRLSDINCLVYFTPPTLLKPFEEWGDYKTLFWWRAYNKIKHDRLTYEKLATIDVSIYALSGLFLAIVQQASMISMLVRHDWLKVGGYNPEYILPILSDEKRISKMAPGAISDTFLVQTKLFIATIGTTPFPGLVKDIKPMYYIGNDRLVSLLGKW